MNKISYLIIFILLIIIFSIFVIWNEQSKITSFEECAAAGYPVMESYPRQCRTPSGELFVEEIYTEIYGTVSLKGELFCPCFLVDDVEVWYDLMEGKPAVDVSAINNGDFVIVKGEFQENQQFWATEISKEEPIGGQRDEHGCLGPAGYSWNQTLDVCLREWELDEIQRSAVEIAMNFLGYHKGLTVLEVLIARCPGCFLVKFDLYQIQFDIIIEDFKVIGNKCKSEDRNVDACIEIYQPVCGMPIKQTFSNSCFACSDESVIYYIEGECA